MKKQVNWWKKFPNEVADFKPIPKWFTKFIKKPKKMSIILISRGYGKNWFYNWWMNWKKEREK